MVNQSRGNHYRAQYLYCTYPTNKSKADILTVLFPGDKTHKTGQMTSIESNEYTGSKIVQNQVTDIALISDAKTKGKNETVSFQGENIFYRQISGKLNSYFVKGLSFDNGEVVRTGFQSDASVSLYLNSTKQKKGMQGKIVSTGTTVTFYCPGISSVLLDGKVVTLLEKGLNTAKINVPIGTYSITIMANSKK
jgi:glucan-binding YG repeat protein